MVTARDAGLVACHRCDLISPMDVDVCTRCGTKISSRKPNSLQRVWAWWIGGLLAYIPANLYPMLATSQLGQTSQDTIMGGVVTLIHHGSVGVAIIIFVASVVVPMAKFAVIAVLAYSVRSPREFDQKSRVHMYEAIEFIGRWSMIDVFVVALLAALVQLGAAANINPGPAAGFFAISVICTILSAQAFDPRLIWDTHPDTKGTVK